MSTVPQTQEVKMATTREPGRTVTPPVDIFEMKEGGLGVVVDLPGVKKEDVELRIENDVLTITGKWSMAPKGSYLYREFEVASYFRQFQLTEQVDQEHIKADLKCGVLTIHLPKTEKAKPRQIKVDVA